MDDTIHSAADRRTNVWRQTLFIVELTLPLMTLTMIILSQHCDVIVMRLHPQTHSTRTLVKQWMSKEVTSKRGFNGK